MPRRADRLAGVGARWRVLAAPHWWLLAAPRWRLLAAASLLAGCASTPDLLPSRAQDQAVATSERAARLLARGDLAAARQGYLGALAAAQAVQDPALEGAALLNLTLVNARLGDLAGAHGAVDRVLAAPARFGPALQARAAARKALLRLDDHAPDEALRWADQADRACLQPCALAAAMHNLRAQVALSRRDAVAAAAAAQRAAAAAVAAAQPAEEAGALRLLARAWMQQADPTLAPQTADALARALALDRRLGQPDRVALDLLLAADNEDQRGNSAAAAELFDRALAVYTATGDRRNADRVRERVHQRQAAAAARGSGPAATVTGPAPGLQ